MKITPKEAKEIFHRFENKVVTKNIEAAIAEHKHAMTQKAELLYLLKLLSLQANKQHV